MCASLGDWCEYLNDRLSVFFAAMTWIYIAVESFLVISFRIPSYIYRSRPMSFPPFKIYILDPSNNANRPQLLWLDRLHQEVVIVLMAHIAAYLFSYLWQFVPGKRNLQGKKNYHCDAEIPIVPCFIHCRNVRTWCLWSSFRSKDLFRSGNQRLKRGTC